MANWDQYYQQAYPASSGTYIQQAPVQYPLLSELRPEDYNRSYPPEGTQQGRSTPAPPFTITQYSSQQQQQQQQQQQYTQQQQQQYTQQQQQQYAQHYGNQQYAGQYGYQQNYYNAAQTGQGNLVNVQNQKHYNQNDPRQNRPNQPAQQQQSKQGQASSHQMQGQGAPRQSKWGQQYPGASKGSGSYGGQQQQRNQPQQHQPLKPQQPKVQTLSREGLAKSVQQAPHAQRQSIAHPSTPQYPPQSQLGGQVGRAQQKMLKMAMSDDMDISDGEEEKRKKSAAIWEYCDVCDIKFSSDKAYHMHCTGMLHTAKLLVRQEMKEIAEPSQADRPPEPKEPEPTYSESRRAGPQTTQAPPKPIEKPPEPPRLERSTEPPNATQIDLTKPPESEFAQDVVEVDWTKGFFQKSGEQLNAAIPQQPNSISNKKDYYCRMCDKRFLGEAEMWDHHIQGKNHCKILLKLQLELGFKEFEEKYGSVEFGLSSNVGPVEAASQAMDYLNVPAEERDKYKEFVFRCGALQQYHCNICNQSLGMVDGWVRHIQSKKHIKKFIFYLTKVKETAQDFWAECGNLPGVYPGRIKDVIPTEGVSLKPWVCKEFGIKMPQPIAQSLNQVPFQGTVTQLKNNFGVIDDYISFDLNLGRGLNLQLRDKVKGAWVASPNTSFKFKAVKLELVGGKPQNKVQPLLPKPGPGGAGVRPPRAGDRDPYGRDAQGRPRPGEQRPPQPGEQRPPRPGEQRPPRPGEQRPPPPHDQRPPPPHEPYYDPYRRGYDPYYRTPYPDDRRLPHPDDRRPAHPADGRPPHPDDRRPPHPDDRRAPYPDDRRPLLPDPKDPYRRPYPDDPYYRAPYPDDRRPPPVGYPVDPRPLPPPDPNDPYRRPYPDDPYYRPYLEDRRPPPPGHPDDPYRRPYPDDYYYRAPYPDDRRPPHPDDRRLPHPDDRRPPHPDDRRPPHPDDPRPLPPDDRRPLPPDDRRPPHPDDRRPLPPDDRRPPPPEDYYRRPYPDDPYYRPPHPDDRRPPPPGYPDDPYQRAPYPDDAYRRAPPDDHPKRPDERVPTVDSREVEIPGIDISMAEDRAYKGLDFEASGPPSAADPKGVPPPAPTPDQKALLQSGAMFSMDELKRLQETLKRMEAAKDDPFKQLALAAELRLLQDKQKAAKELTKSIPLTQSQALKKLSDVMSEQQMEQLKKEMNKLEKKSKGRDERKREGRRPERSERTDRQERQDRSTSNRSKHGGKSSAQKQIEDSIISEFQEEKAPWDNEQTNKPPRDIFEEPDNTEENKAPWDGDSAKAPWEDSNKEDPWETNDKSEDPWEADDKKASAPWDADVKVEDSEWESSGNKDTPFGDAKSKSLPWSAGEANDAPWDSEEVQDAPWEAEVKAQDDWGDDPKDSSWDDDRKPDNDVSIVTSDSKIKEIRSRSSEAASVAADPWTSQDDAPWDVENKDTSWESPKRQDTDIRGMGGKSRNMPGGEGVALITPDVEAKIRAARKLGGDGKKSSELTLVTGDIEAKIREAREQVKRGGSGRQPEGGRPRQPRESRWGEETKAQDSPWDSKQEGVTLVTSDIEARIKEARKQREREENKEKGDAWGSAEKPKKTSWRTAEELGDTSWSSGNTGRDVPTPWDSGRKVEIVSAPWDTERREKPAAKPWDTERRENPTAKPWDTERRENPAAKPWDTEQRENPAAKPWDTEQRENPAAKPWDTERRENTAAKPWDTERRENPAAKPWDTGREGRDSSPWGSERKKVSAPWDNDKKSSEEMSTPWDEERKTDTVVAPWREERKVEVAPWQEERKVQVAPWQKDDKDIVAPWEKDSGRVVRNKSPPQAAAAIPAQAPWERDVPKKQEVSAPAVPLGAIPPWANKTREPEIEKLSITRSDVQAAKRAPWNKSKDEDDRGLGGSVVAPWVKEHGSRDILGDTDIDYRREINLKRSADAPWNQNRKSERHGTSRGGVTKQEAVEAVQNFLIAYEDFHRQGGSHLTFEQLSPEVRELVRHIKEVTYNSMEDVISTVHLLLAFDPAVTEMLQDYSPQDLRQMAETHNRIQVQALEILSVSVRHLVELHRSGSGGSAESLGEKRQAPPPWGHGRHGQEKRPRF